MTAFIIRILCVNTIYIATVTTSQASHTISYFSLLLLFLYSPTFPIKVYSSYGQGKWMMVVLVAVAAAAGECYVNGVSVHV